MTIILTTHYIQEAEDMADRIGVINKGEMILVEDKTELMHKLGKKQLTLQLHQQLDAIPAELAGHNLALVNGGHELDLHLRHARASAPASPDCSPILPPPASGSRTSTRRKARSRTSSSIW